MATHYLDVRITIDALDLYTADNLSGIKLALGVIDDNLVLNEFAAHVLQKVENLLEGFVNLNIQGYALYPIEELIDDNSEVPHRITDEEEIFAAKSDNDILSEIENHIFNIEAERGEVESIVVRSPIIFKLLNIMVDTGEVVSKVILREDLDSNFMIRYINVENKTIEMKELGN